MDEALQIRDYLPSSFSRGSEGEYINFLWEAFEENYHNGKYQFAMLACHMIYMSFVYFSIWKIKHSRPHDFEKSLVGFSKEDEKELLEATSPFTYWTINESRIFRFLKLIGCCNNDIGQFAKLVQQRNEIAHPNGNIFFSDQTTANKRISEILRQMDAIQNHMLPVIHDCFRRFLIDSSDAEQREYEDPADQIREVLIHGNYFSQKDVEACLTFDIRILESIENYSAIREFFAAFTHQFGAKVQPIDN